MKRSVRADVYARSVLCGVLILCTGCSWSNSGRNRLRVLINDSVEGEALKAAVEIGSDPKVKSSHPFTGRVTITQQSYDPLHHFLTDTASKSSDYDVVMIDDPWLPELAGEEDSDHLRLSRLKDPGKDLDTDFVEACRKVCRYPYGTGPFYAVPFVGNSQFLFYDKTQIEPSALNSWPAIAKAAEKPGKPGHYGFVMRAAPGNAAVTDFLPILWASGESLLCVNTPGAIEALEMMLRLGRRSPEAYPEFNDYDVAEYMRKRAASVSINWFAWSAFVDEAAENDASQPNDKTRSGFKSMVPDGHVIGHARLPSRPNGHGAGVIGNWLLGIPESSKQKELAKQFLDFVTDGRVMVELAKRGAPPTRNSVFDDHELCSKYPWYKAQKAALENARPRGPVPYWHEIEEKLGNLVAEANAGSLRPDDAMHKAACEIKRAADKYTETDRESPDLDPDSPGKQPCDCQPADVRNSKQGPQPPRPRWAPNAHAGS